MYTYIFKLERYTGRNSRHTCPNCGKKSFTLYVDEAGNPISNKVGRCDHESSCGYHYTPRDYFREHPETKDRLFFDTIAKPMQSPQPKFKQKPDYIPYPLIQRSESTDNTLMDYLKKFWPQSELEKITKMYHLGSTRNREIIFPQIDGLTNCRTGKVMNYDTNGHRIKGEVDAIDWLHARLMRQQGKKASDFRLEQCLFGQHLLSKRPDAVVGMTESEKSAVIAAIHWPNIVWVSTGGINGLTPERCAALKGRDVVLYPDADATDLWTQKAEALKPIAKGIRVSDWAKNEPKGSKRDIADIVLDFAKTLKEQKRPTTIGDVMEWAREAGVEKQIHYNIF